MNDHKQNLLFYPTKAQSRAPLLYGTARLGAGIVRYCEDIYQQTAGAYRLMKKYFWVSKLLVNSPVHSYVARPLRSLQYTFNVNP